MTAAALLLVAFAAADVPADPSAPAAVSLEIRDPAALLAHPLIGNVWAELNEAPGVREARRRPELDAVLDPLRFLAGRCDRDVPTLLADLTAGGVRFDWSGEENGPAALTIAAASPEVWQEFLPALRTWLSRTADPLTALAAIPPDLQDGQEWTVGSLRYQLDGATLSLASGGAPYAPRAAGEDHVHLRIDLHHLRESGRLPAEAEFQKDPAFAALLGGYAASLLSANQFDLSLADSGAKSDGLSLRIAMDGEERLPGFFAPPDAVSPAPLNVAGALYSASWYRDYRTLWDARGSALPPEQVEALEARDFEIRQGIKVLGADVLPSELASAFDSSWRAVVVNGEREYLVAATPPLPAAGLAVSLRDRERFEDLARPALSAIRLVAVFGGAKMQPFRTRGSEGELDLSGLRFLDRSGADSVGDRARFNVAPTWTVHRGHFVVASTRPLVRSIAAALDAEAESPHRLPPGVTESQRFEPEAFAAALDAAGASVRFALIAEGGFDSLEAAAIQEAAARALRSLGPITVTTAVDDSGLSLEMQFTPAASDR
ncbi:hypothetical protein [Alienimonas chondri]|uniref:DUF2066 domain-containing protein n=1 Tax=Alienimonas chondri TaxID=2681879 RepID=A0ABX1VID2_9PLAN|nr:hypothetical protein [Alienimonas chondri]NNJ27615.1 hypothetical protein [Alienimonas chondri]